MAEETDENDDNHYNIKKWAKENLASKIIDSPIGYIKITMTGIKETLNQPHKWKNEKDKCLYDLDKLILTSNSAGSATDSKGKIKQYHYLEIIINGEPSFIVIKETWDGSKNFYSIVDKLRAK